MCDSYASKTGVWVFEDSHCQGQVLQIKGHEINDIPFQVKSFVQASGYVIRWLLRDPQNGLIFETYTRDDDWESGSVYEETELFFPFWEVSPELNASAFPQGWIGASLLQAEAMQITESPDDESSDDDPDQEQSKEQSSKINNESASKPTSSTSTFSQATISKALPQALPQAALPNKVQQSIKDSDIPWWTIVGVLGTLILVVLAGAYYWSTHKSIKTARSEKQKRKKEDVTFQTTDHYFDSNSSDYFENMPPEEVYEMPMPPFLPQQNFLQ